MREKKDCRYFSFPIVLLDGIFENKMQCLNQMFDYSAYKKSLDYEGNESERYKQALKYLGVTNENEKKSIENGKYLIDSIPDNLPTTSINIDVFFDYYKNSKTEYEIAQLTAVLAIKSILGKKDYYKTNKKLIIARMFGFNSVKELPENTHILLKKYSNKYQIDKLLNELQLYWGLKLFSDHCRGFYLSFKLSLKDLAKINIEAKKSVKLNDLKLRKKEALQAAKKELNQ